MSRQRAIVTLFVIALMVGAANLFFTSSEVGQLRAAVLASCAFAADLGSAPFPAGKVSKLGVSIVADSREQFRRLGCPGHLAPPGPGFVKWARYYHLPER